MSAVLRRRCRPGILSVEFTASSLTFWCDPRVNWGTLALHPASRRRSPSRAAAHRRVPSPPARAQHRGRRSPNRRPRSIRPRVKPVCARSTAPPSPLSRRRRWIAIQRPDPTPPVKPRLTLAVLLKKPRASSKLQPGPSTLGKSLQLGPVFFSLARDLTFYLQNSPKTCFSHNLVVLAPFLAFFMSTRSPRRVE
jgi:hypothetical protein